MTLDFFDYKVKWRVDVGNIEVGIITPPVEIPIGVITHFNIIHIIREEWRLLLMGDDTNGKLVTHHNLFEGTKAECITRALNWLKARRMKLERELDEHAK